MARSMPYSPEAEQALLASMIMYPSSVTIASDEGLMVDDFYLEANRKMSFFFVRKENGKWDKEVKYI